MAFARESATYRSRLPALLAFEGRWVVVSGERIDGPFGDYEAALEFGYRYWGLGGGWMVKQVRETEPVHHFTREV